MTIEEVLKTKHFGRQREGVRTPLSQEEIGHLAHSYWEERQKHHLPGSELDDWLRAEAELIRQREAAIDEASEESFPASDPPGW